MGWCSGTEIFDDFCEGIINTDSDKEQLIERMINALENMDWDCQNDSAFYDHPLVNKVMRRLHPDWFDE